jgi:hypothetical protein
MLRECLQFNILLPEPRHHAVVHVAARAVLSSQLRARANIDAKDSTLVDEADDAVRLTTPRRPAIMVTALQPDVLRGLANGELRRQIHSRCGRKSFSGISGIAKLRKSARSGLSIELQ